MGNDKPERLFSASTKWWWWLSPVIVVVAATVAALLSHSPAGKARISADSASTWLLSTRTQWIGRTNALMTRPQLATTDQLRLPMSPAATAERRGTTLIVDDPVLRTASLIDLRTLRRTTVPVSADARVDVAGGRAYLLEPRTGRVSTVPDGATVVSTPGAAFGAWIVSAHALWVTVPARGTVWRIGAAGPATAVRGFPPGRSPLLAEAPAGVALLDGRTLTTIATDGAVRRHRTSGVDEPVGFGLSPDGGTVVVRGPSTLDVTRLSDGRSAGMVPLGGPAHRWGRLVVRRDAAYLADDTTGALWRVRISPEVALLPPIDVAGRGTVLDLFADGELVWANDAAGPRALAVDESGRAWPVTKYAAVTPSPSPSLSRTTAAPTPHRTPPATHSSSARRSPATATVSPRADPTAKPQPKLSPRPGPKPKPKPKPTDRTPTPVEVRATFGRLGNDGEVARCESVHLSVSLPTSMTLLVAVRRTTPSSDTWYFNYVGSRDGNVRSHTAVVYFGSAASQRYRAVLLAMDVEDARDFYDGHDEGDFAAAAGLPPRAEITDERAVEQTSTDCDA